MSSITRFTAHFFLAIALLRTASSLRAEDWPEWRGKGRGGVWNETGIVQMLGDDQVLENGNGPATHPE